MVSVRMTEVFNGIIDNKVEVYTDISAKALGAVLL